MRVAFSLDVLKPHEPGNNMVAREIKKLDGVKYVSIKTDEIDNVTTSVFITVEGTEEISLDQIREKLEDLNCALHSVDRVQVYDDDWLSHDPKE
jgi:hypothetical protein